jgi:ADP-ribose pyrophosphatase
LWELPAGLTDEADETAVQAAQRELLEETGYRASSLVPLISFYTTPGGNSEQIQVFHGTDLTYQGRIAMDGEERELEIEWFDFNSVVRDVLSGNIKSPSAVVGIMALALQGR